MTNELSDLQKRLAVKIVELGEMGPSLADLWIGTGATAWARGADLDIIYNVASVEAFIAADDEAIESRVQQQREAEEEFERRQRDNPFRHGPPDKLVEKYFLGKYGEERTKELMSDEAEEEIDDLDPSIADDIRKLL